MIHLVMAAERSEPWAVICLPLYDIAVGQTEKT